MGLTVVLVFVGILLLSNLGNGLVVTDKTVSSVSFDFTEYLTAIKKEFARFAKGDFGTVEFGISKKTYPITHFLGQMVTRSLSYLLLGVTIGIVLGYLFAILAVVLPLIGKLLDVVHTMMISMPEVLVVTLLQIIAIWIDGKVGYTMISIAQYGIRVPFLIPLLSISIMPAALVYGAVRIGTEREWTQDYINTAYMKGLSKNQVFLAHVLRNATPDLLSVLPRTITVGITTMVIIEVLSDILGLGGFFTRAGVMNNSIVTSSVVLACFALLSNLFFSYLSRRFVVSDKEAQDA